MTLVLDRVVSEAFVRAERPRRVLVYAPLAYSTPHFETDLEIAQRHLDLGDEVELVLCDAELSACQLNPSGEPTRCVQCVSRNLQGAAQLSARVPVLSLLGALTAEDHARLAQLPRRFSDDAALRKFCFDGFDAGLATLSSVIDFARTPSVDPRQLSGLIHRLLHGAVATYLALRRMLAAQTYDRVYIYNGRWSMVRSAVRACEKMGVEYYTHERGADFTKFALYRNVLPHDKDDFRRQTAAAWEAAKTQPETLAIAESFFRERRQRVEKFWFSFVKQQESGRVPADWDSATRRIVLFTSSEFEFAAISDEATGRIFRQQTLGARRIAQHLVHTDPAARLWIRVHPNDNTPETVRRWQEGVGALTNATLVLPGETIDSYAMLDGAERVITFGSTIGVEATYWGKPSICADDSFFDGLDCSYEAATEAELFELLARRDLPPKPREHALRYGYYLNTVGGNFVHFVTGAISDYEFKSPFRGRCLKPDYDDLRQSLVKLHDEGDVHRTLAVATVCARFRPADGLAHSLRVLSLLRLNQPEAALSALEEIVALATPPNLELILKNTAKALLDSTMLLAKQAPAARFQSIARRAGEVMLRAPAFAAMGQKLIAMASRATRKTSAPEAALPIRG